MLDVSLNFQPIHPFVPHNNVDDGDLVPFIGIDGKKKKEDWTRNAIKGWTKKGKDLNETKEKVTEDQSSTDEFIEYIVQPGDTGNALISSLGVRAQDLATWNPPPTIDLTKDDWNLKAGAVLRYKETSD